jgi:hypothetical protein
VRVRPPAVVQGTDLKPTDSLTLLEFFELTKDNYGGKIIRQTAKEYGVNIE